MRPRHCLSLLSLFAAVAGVTPAEARLGEKLSDLRQRFGKPQGQPAKDMQVWLIEEAAGPLLYTVTFGADGRSIAEGLKPHRQAKLTEPAARAFIRDQLTVLADPAKVRAVRAGEAYTFAGQAFTCGEGEQAFLDEQGGVLIVWTPRDPASVMAVTAEFVQRKAP
jgi:hypothetical protein